MHQIDTPLFASPCLGAIISHVEVFATHIRFEQKLWRDITVTADMIASVERYVYQYHGCVILRTTSRRRIICIVAKNRVDRVYNAIQRCAANSRRITLPEVIARV